MTRSLGLEPSGNVHSVSVLMSTYAGETAANLEQALGSLAAQSVPPSEIVLVVDGAVDVAQERVIATFDCAGAPLVVVRLPKRSGLAQAMNAGLERCRGTYVMRMDSDDVCESDRIEVQMSYLASHPDIDLVGSWVREFSDDNLINGLKSSPCAHGDIAKALRFRNVLVHPTIVVKRDRLKAVGGYHDTFGMLEDYDLYVRLVCAGAALHVIPKVLVRVRTSLAQRARRGGFGYLRKELKFRWHCLRSGFLTPAEFLITAVLYGIFRLAGPARRSLYGLVRT